MNKKKLIRVDYHTGMSQAQLFNVGCSAMKTNPYGMLKSEKNGTSSLQQRYTVKQQEDPGRTVLSA